MQQLLDSINGYLKSTDLELVKLGVTLLISSPKEVFQEVFGLNQKGSSRHGLRLGPDLTVFCKGDRCVLLGSLFVYSTNLEHIDYLSEHLTLKIVILDD